MNRWVGFVLIACTPCFAELRLSAVFSDGMVLQRNGPVPIWGWAEPGEKVSVSFAGQNKAAVAGTCGRWQAVLDPMSASFEQRELSVHSQVSMSQLRVPNVLVGDVWLCSGQSNMGVGMGRMLSFKQDQEAADCPGIRMFKVGFELSLEPQESCEGSWTVCSP